MDYKKAFEKASAICARQECCVFDIRQKLVKWEVTGDDAEKLISRLLSEKFIDESRYTGFFVRDKYRFNRWGKQKIIWKLRQKGIDETIINEALESIIPEDYKDNLLQLLKEKDRQLKHDDPYKRNAALMRFGASRGFGFDEVRKAIEGL
jgi:regulatory protein